jgi:hypothetical protein
VYKFRDGYYAPKGISANDVAQEIISQRETGEATASRTVQRASDPTHRLHGAFTWDNEKAGHEFRLIQARHLLSSVILIPDEKIDVPKTLKGEVRFLQHVPSEDGRGEGAYVPTTILTQNFDQFGRALREVRSRLASANAHFQELNRLAKQMEKDQETMEILSLASDGLTVASEALASVA